MAKPVADWVLSAHAEREIARRGIDKAIVAQVLANPEQRLSRYSTSKIGKYWSPTP
jgi:hypothetical protein